jgi:hypothetical protein
MNYKKDEHWIVDEQTGRLKGVYALDLSKLKKSTEGIWGFIDQVICDYTVLHPHEIQDCIDDAKNARLMARSDMVMSKGKTMQYGLKIPVGLLLKLQEIEPELFENKRLFTKFKRRYQAFTVAKTKPIA